MSGLTSVALVSGLTSVALVLALTFPNWGLVLRQAGKRFVVLGLVIVVVVGQVVMVLVRVLRLEVV